MTHLEELCAHEGVDLGILYMHITAICCDKTDGSKITPAEWKVIKACVEVAGEL